jgi:amidase
MLASTNIWTGLIRMTSMWRLLIHSHKHIIQKILTYFQNLGGSSSGSAISVSAGFSPISIGTETIGSIIVPTDRAALYTLKPTVGIVPQSGIYPVYPRCDAAGPMAKSALDVANILDVIVEPSMTMIPVGGYRSAVTRKWEGIRIGVVRTEE